LDAQGNNITYLKDIFNPKKNSFGFIRLFLAALVIFAHSYPLGGFNRDEALGNTQDYGSFAVDGFFILSGFLITRSYMTSGSILGFLWNRFLRIFPGFWGCLIVTILFFAPIIYWIDHGSLHGYFNIQTNNPLDYFKVNFLLDVKQYGIANLLQKNPYPVIFNASLWTLIYELKCYFFIGCLGGLGILHRQKKIVLYLFILLWLVSVIDIVIQGFASKIFPLFSDVYMLRLTMYFLSGSVCFLFMENIVVSKKLFLFAISLIAISINNNFYFYPLIAPLAIPYILFVLAFKMPFTNFDKYGDFSYGLYIYSYPIQQMLSFFGLNKTGFIIYLMLSLLTTIIPSILSYYLIEKTFLKFKIKRITVT